MDTKLSLAIKDWQRKHVAHVRAAMVERICREEIPTWPTLEKVHQEQVREAVLVALLIGNWTPPKKRHSKATINDVVARYHRGERPRDICKALKLTRGQVGGILHKYKHTGYRVAPPREFRHGPNGRFVECHS